jgi:nucleotide-binding universal stress UspA family protein
MYKNILLAIDLNDEASCRKPLLSAVELARTFGARLHILTVVREVEAILEARAATIAYEVIVSDLEKPDRRPHPACRRLRAETQRTCHAWRQHLCRDFRNRRGSRG